MNIRGRVTDIIPDEDLEFIDKMSLRYTGQAYFRRGYEREVFVITPERIQVGRGGWARKPAADPLSRGYFQHATYPWTA